MALLQEDLIDVMPAVEEANSISEELDKKVKFEIILISPHMLGKMQGQAKADVRIFWKFLKNLTTIFLMLQGFKDLKSTKPEVCVKMKNLENGTEFIWPKEKFLNRLYLMKEMYNNYEVVWSTQFEDYYKKDYLSRRRKRTGMFLRTMIPSRRMPTLRSTLAGSR